MVDLKYKLNRNFYLKFYRSFICNVSIVVICKTS